MSDTFQYVRLNCFDMRKWRFQRGRLRTILLWYRCTPLPSATHINLRANSFFNTALFSQKYHIFTVTNNTFLASKTFSQLALFLLQTTLFTVMADNIVFLGTARQHL